MKFYWETRTRWCYSKVWSSMDPKEYSHTKCQCGHGVISNFRLLEQVKCSDCLGKQPKQKHPRHDRSQFPVFTIPRRVPGVEADYSIE